MSRFAVASLALLSVLPLPSLAQHNHAMAPATADAAPAKAAPMSEGVVRKIDRGAREVTIAHGPLANLGMGPMTMTFRLSKLDLANGLTEGSRVRFVAENVNNELVVVALTAVK